MGSNVQNDNNRTVYVCGVPWAAISLCSKWCVFYESSLKSSAHCHKQKKRTTGYFKRMSTRSTHHCKTYKCCVCPPPHTHTHNKSYTHLSPCPCPCPTMSTFSTYLTNCHSYDKVYMLVLSCSACVMIHVQCIMYVTNLHVVLLYNVLSGLANCIVIIKYVTV